MRIDVMISICDYGRIGLLQKCIQSLHDSTYKDIRIYIVVDANKQVFDSLAIEQATILYNENRMDWPYSMNKILRYVSDSAIYASDDLEFLPDCIEKAVQAMEKYFPDGDGLIGIRQNVKGCNSAFGLVGWKFIERFPNRMVFCPDFIHYSSDFELGRFARNIGKFHFCEEALVNHRRLKDETWRLAYKARRRDYEVMAERRQKGLVWGESFELVSDWGRKQCN